jgi:hypothetical protein
MPRKSDTPSQFLGQLLKEAKQGFAEELDLKVVETMKRLGAPKVGSAYINWDDPIITDAWAASLWKIRPGEIDQPVAVAFEKAGLSPKNPIHWRLLFSYFCLAHFRPSRRRGAPEKWTAERYAELLQDEDIAKNKHPEFSKENIYRTIGKQRKYKKTNGEPVSVGRIKTALRDARDPECNAQLAIYVNRAVQQARAYAQENGLPWSPEGEAGLIKRQIDEYCETIASAWRRAKNP